MCRTLHLIEFTVFANNNSNDIPKLFSNPVVQKMITILRKKQKCRKPEFSPFCYNVFINMLFLDSLTHRAVWYRMEKEHDFQMRKSWCQLVRGQTGMVLHSKLFVKPLCIFYKILNRIKYKLIFTRIKVVRSNQ